MRAYTIAIVFLSALHTYFSVSKGNSPLSWEFLLLLLSPLLFFAWKDIQNIKFGKDGLKVEKAKKVNEYISKAMLSNYSISNQLFNENNKYLKYYSK